VESTLFYAPTHYTMNGRKRSSIFLLGQGNRI